MMTKLKVPLFTKYCLLLLMAQLYALVSAGKDFKDFDVRHYGDESLPQTSISDLYPDKDGFLWIGTQMGLTRFDGQHFKVFTPDNTPQLKSVRSFSFYWDKNNEVYFVDGAIRHYRLSHEGPQVVSPEGRAFMHGRVFRAHKELPFPIAGGIKDTGSFFYLGWRIDNKIRYYYSFDKDSAYYEIPETPLNHDPSFFDKSRFYIFDQYFQVTSLFPGAPPKKVVAAGDLLKNPLLGDHNAYFESKVYEQADGNYLFWGNCIYAVEVIHDTVFTTEVISNIDLPDVRAFYADKKNGYYALGTDANGLFILRPRQFSTRVLKTDVDGRSNIFYAVVPFKDNLFLSAKGYIFDLHGEYERYLESSIVSQFSLYRDKQKIWLWRDGYAQRLDIKTEKAENMFPDGGWSVQIEPDKWGRLWFVSIGNIGWAVGNTYHQLITHLPDRQGNNRFIEYVLVKDEHTIWICLRDGLVSMDINTRKLTEIPGMAGKYVRKLIADEKGGIWVLTYGNGYYYYKNGRFISMPHDRNDYLTSVHAMLTDKNGYCWMSTNKGLFRVGRQVLYNYVEGRSKEVQYEYFNKQCGFLTNEFNGGCSPGGSVISDSLIILPSMIGLVHFNPLNIKTAPLDNGIYVDNIVINGKKRPTAASFTVPADFTSFRCDVSSPYYGLSENFAPEYRIEGVMDDWQPLIEGRYIQFNRLPHGDYTIRIRKVTNYLTGSIKEQRIKFSVLEPWYLEMWFLVLCIGFAVCVIWLLFWLRLRIVTLQKQKLEAQVNERTVQLNESLVQLKSTVENLEQSQADLYRSNRFREQLTSIVLHDIQTPLRFLQRVMKHVMQGHRNMTPEKLSSELDELYSSTAEVASYSEDFLTWIKAQRDAFEITYKDVRICSLLEEIGGLYHKIATNSGTQIQIDCPEDIFLHTDAALLSIIVRNLTDNAVKYSPKGRIVITGARKEGGVMISVKDNGKGMTEEQVDKIMNEDSGRTVTAAGKLGYQFIKDLLRVLGGNLRIVSQPGQGTEVSLYFTNR